MAGFREFLTGEVLTAANVDDFLMKQSVQKYADAAARDAALGTAVAGGNALREGMVAYLDDTDDLLKYDGSAWAAVGGAVVEAKFAVKTDTQSMSLSSQGTAGVTGLTIAHSVADAANKVYLLGQLSGTSAGGNLGFSAFLTANGTAIHVGNADGLRGRVQAQQRNGNTASLSAMTLISEHSPGSTSSVTYSASFINVRAIGDTLFVNRSADDTDALNFPRAVSSLLLVEVRA